MKTRELILYEGVALLVELVDRIRPNPGPKLTELVQELQADPQLRRHFAKTVRQVLSETRMLNALHETGILANIGLGEGLRKLAGEMFLPRMYPADDLRTLLRQVFRRRNDWKWVLEVPAERWVRLVRLVIRPKDAIGIPHEDVAVATVALAQRIGALGIDEDVNRILDEVDEYDSPFLKLSIKTDAFLRSHRQGKGSSRTFEEVSECARQCRSLILHLRKRKDSTGTSMRLTGISRRLLQQLDRFELLLHIVRPQSVTDFARQVVPLFQRLIKAEQTSGSLLRFARHKLDLVSYQITEHTANKGEKYVARTAREYGGFFVAALGGGVLVAIFAVFKLFLLKLQLPLAVQAILYGLNYSICFVLIYLTGAILATKTPATTGSTIVRLLDSARGRSKGLERVADLVVLIWRAQFISFVGNLLAAFPAAIAIAYVLEQFLGVVAADIDKSQALIDANHPIESAALFYAGIAGVLLFLAGVIQGAVDNRLAYSRFEDRLIVHPRLAFLGRFRPRVVKFMVRNGSGIAGNTALGFMLGSAGVMGVILGLPIDIRHIAFSSAHFGVATLDAPSLVDPRAIYSVLLGVVGIGIVNFSVSFGLTLIVAFLSRGISHRQRRALSMILLKRALRRPLHWWLPMGRYEPMDVDKPIT